MTSMKRSSDAMEQENIDTQNQIIDIPNNLEVRSNFINQEMTHVVQRLCLESRKAKGLPDANSEPTKSLLPRLEAFLRWLETSVEITPALKQRSSKIATGLELMYKNPEYHFEHRTKERARRLYERWEAQNWGKGEVVEESTDDETLTGGSDEAAPDAKRRRSSSGAQGSGTIIVPTKIRAPPANHPIFGEDGIMHGVVLKISSRRKDYILDSRYEKTDAKVFGDNGLDVGQWWPMQIVALFRGAHGSKTHLRYASCDGYQLLPRVLAPQHTADPRDDGPGEGGSAREGAEGFLPISAIIRLRSFRWSCRRPECVAGLSSTVQSYPASGDAARPYAVPHTRAARVHAPCPASNTARDA